MKTKGNQFEKFDEAEIQKLLGNKGIQAYDIHKNPFDKGNYNTINIKIKGNDDNNELYNKVKKVQEDLRGYSRGSSADQGLSKLCEGVIRWDAKGWMNEGTYIRITL